MRLISEAVRAILRWGFGLEDRESVPPVLKEDPEALALLEQLCSMAERGEIGAAEDLLFAATETRDRRFLQAAILFYSRINDLDDAFLETCGFPREEIAQGLRAITLRYGVGAFTDALEDFDA